MMKFKNSPFLFREKKEYYGLQANENTLNIKHSVEYVMSVLPLIIKELENNRAILNGYFRSFSIEQQEKILEKKLKSCFENANSSKISISLKKEIQHMIVTNLVAENANNTGNEHYCNLRL